MRLILLLMLSCVVCCAQAQTLTELYLWGNETPALTTRSRSTGHTIHARGGDLASSYYNPAGLALMPQVEVQLSGGLGTLDNTLPSNHVFFDLKPNYFLGAVFPLQLAPKDSERTWKQLSIGVNVYQLQYDNLSIRKPIDRQASQRFVRQMLDQASGLEPEELDPYTTSLVHESGVLRHDGNGQYQFVIDNPVLDPMVRDSILNDPFILYDDNVRSLTVRHAASLSLSSTLGERWHVGMTIHVPWLHYYGVNGYDFDTVDGQFYQRIRYRSFRSLQGWGMGAKLGLLYDAKDWLRLGAHMSTPTWYSLAETYSTNFRADTGSYQSVSYRPANNRNQTYGLQSPWKMGLSGAAFLGKEKAHSVLLTVGYEHVPDLGLIERSTAARDLRAQVGDRYQGRLTLGVGAEWTLGILKIRHGVALASSPYREYPQWDQHWTLGLGVEWEHFYFDLGGSAERRSGAYEIDFVRSEGYYQITSFGLQLSFGVRFGAKPIRFHP